MKTWNQLQKGDKLYLLIPYMDDDNIKYEYQESEVISNHPYENTTNIRFKYTDIIGKRRRVNLVVNKTKYEYNIVSLDKKTSYSAHHNIEYGDMIVSYVSKESLYELKKVLINNEIYKSQKFIDKCNEYIKALTNLLNEDN